MPRGDVLEAITKMSGQSWAERAAMPTIGEGRATLMLSGCAILSALLEVFTASHMRVADRGLREGLLLTMMYGPKRKTSSNRRRSSKRRKTTPDKSAPATKD